MSRDAILIEDKRFDIHNLPKKVLKGAPDSYKLNAKSRIYDDYKRDENEVILNDNLLKFVTDGLNFETEVVKTTCAHALTYNPTDGTELFKDKTQLSNNVRILQKTEIPKPLRKWPKLKEKNAQKAIEYHEMISEPEKPRKIEFKSKQFFEVLNTKGSFTAKSSSIRTAKSFIVSEDASEDSKDKSDGVFLTETTPIKFSRKKVTIDKQDTKITSKSLTNLESLSEMPTNEWDDYLISKISENTARWIIAKKTEPKQREKLSNTFQEIYKKPIKLDADIQLYEETMSEVPEDSRKKSGWKNPNDTLLTPANNIEVDQHDIPLYRLPQGIRRKVIMEEKEQGDRYNRTAQNINFEHVRALSAKTFQEIIKDKVETTNTVFLTDNDFQIEMTNGDNNHLYVNDFDLIQLENGKKFTKSTQIVYPKQFTDWMHEGKNDPIKISKKRPKRGHKRWIDLPKDLDAHEMIEPTDHQDFGQTLWNLVLPTTPDVRIKKIVKTNSTVAYIVEEWRRRWQIGSRWDCAEIDELIRDMKDINANIRFQAVVICSRAAEYTDQQNQDLWKSDTPIVENDEFLNSEEEAEKDDYLAPEESPKRQTLKDVKSLPEKLFVAIECLLDDTNDKVRLAAAITIYTVERNKKAPKAKEKAEAILRETMDSTNLADKYAAAQCLASDGICEYKIILTLLQNYFSSNERITREQMTKLLSNLSRKSFLVNSMVGEYLNNDDLRYKILSCKLLPCLRRALNKDLTNKLIYLMWHDNNKTVRKVAAQTLGRTGRGQNVHDELCLRLQSKDVNDRIEALRKIQYLGIMTAKLLIPFLECFKDDYINVRELACKAAQKLQVKDENVILSLIELSQYDKIPKVKARAIETLGLTSVLRNDIKSCLLWALRYELDPLVRASAAHSLVLLAGNQDQDVLDALQERYLIDSDPIVKKELNDALTIVGLDPGQDMAILSQIKNEVRKLNTKEIIWNKISSLEKALEFEFNKKRFIYTKPDDGEEEKNDEKSSSIDLKRKKKKGGKATQKPSVKEASTSEPPLMMTQSAASSTTIDIVAKENNLSPKKRTSTTSSHQSDTVKSVSGSSLESKSFLSKLVEEVVGDSNSDMNDDSSENININELSDEPSLLSQQQLVVRSFQSIKEIDTIYEETQEILA